jgi:hypothetical protein
LVTTTWKTIVKLTCQHQLNRNTCSVCLVTTKVTRWTWQQFKLNTLDSTLASSLHKWQIKKQNLIKHWYSTLTNKFLEKNNNNKLEGFIYFLFFLLEAKPLSPSLLLVFNGFWLWPSVCVCIYIYIRIFQRLHISAVMHQKIANLFSQR